MIHRELEKSITKIKPQKPRTDQLIPAVLGLWFEDQTLTEVPNRPGYVYTRIRNNLSEVVQVFNDIVSPVFGLQVLLIRDAVDRSRYRIYGKDLGVYPSGWGSGTVYPFLESHGDKHSFTPDGDITWIYGQQFLPFLVYPGTTGTAYIWPYTYHYGSEWFHAGSTGTSNLLPYNPTGSSARMVLVYSDHAGNPQLLAGSSYFSSTITGTAQVIPHLPDPPSNCLYPLAGVRLVSGTSSIGWENIYDVRPHFDATLTGTVTSSGATGTFMNPMIATGDMIYSDYNSITGSAINLAVSALGATSTGSSRFSVYTSALYVLQSDVAHDSWASLTWASAGVAGGDPFVGTNITIDLSSSQEVGSFGMNQYTNINTQASKYKVETSDDAVTWTTQFASHTAAPGPYEIVNFPSPVTARHFRFTALESRYPADPTGGPYNWIIYDIKLYDIASTSTQTPQRLPIGDENQVLTVYNGIPTWVDPAWIYGTILIYDDNTFATSGTAIHFNDNLDVITSGSSVWINGSAGGGASTPTYPAIYDDHVFKTTGTALDFVGNVSVAVTGTTAYINVEGGAGAATIYYDDSVYKITGTAVNFTEDIAVIASGTVAHVGIPTGTFSRPTHTHPSAGGSGDNTLLIYDDSTFKVTGTAVSFNSGLSVSVTGSVAFVNHEYAEIIYVAKTGAKFSSVQSAINSISDATSAKRYLIAVLPGTYQEQVIMKDWVDVRGAGKHATRFSYGSSSGTFTLSDWCQIEDILIETTTTATDWAIWGDDKSDWHIRNVDILSADTSYVSQGIKNVGTTWDTCFIEHCVMNIYSQTGYGIYLSSDGANLADVNINDLYLDTYEATTGGGIYLDDIIDVRIRDSLLRTKSSGFDLSINGSSDVRVWGSWFEFGTSSIEVGVGSTLRIATSSASSYSNAGTIIGQIEDLTTYNQDRFGALNEIRFLGTAGGGYEGIAYLDSSSTAVRLALMFPGSDVVRLGNRAANGVVQISGNTSTAGSGGEVIAAQFEDDKIVTYKLLVLPELSAPGTPASGYAYLYTKTDGKIYLKNDSGIEYDLTVTGTSSVGGGGGNPDLLIYDDNVFKVTGTALAFADNVTVSVTGSVAYIQVDGVTGSTGPAGADGATGPMGPAGASTIYYDDSVFKVTGTAVSFNNGLDVTVTGSVVFVDWTGNGGWIPYNGTWVYASADDPTYTMWTNANITGSYSPGLRLKLSQATGGTKYFILTDVSYSSGTTFTMYGGTDYDLNNETISNPQYSFVKAPNGFPISPIKWTVEVTDSDLGTQATPAQNTWYNAGSTSISIPIGSWKVNYKAVASISDATGAGYAVQLTLSTANNSESDAQFSTFQSATTVTLLQAFNFVEKYLLLTSKTTYYLNIRTTTGSVDNIYIRGDLLPSIIRATCAYL